MTKKSKRSFLRSESAPSAIAPPVAAPALSSGMLQSSSAPMDELFNSSLENLAPEMVDPFHRSDGSGCGYRPRLVCRNVSFDSVDVREYDLTVGDNPSCHYGPPVSLDWNYSRQSSKNLEEYEAERSPHRSGNLKKFHMNKYTRKHILAFEWGHTVQEMKEARKETKKMQRQRSMTLKLMPLLRAEEMIETTLGGLMLAGSRKRGNSNNISSAEEAVDDWIEEEQDDNVMSSSASNFQNLLLSPKRGGLSQREIFSQRDLLMRDAPPALPPSDNTESSTNTASSNEEHCPDDSSILARGQKPSVVIEDVTPQVKDDDSVSSLLSHSEPQAAVAPGPPAKAEEAMRTPPTPLSDDCDGSTPLPALQQLTPSSLSPSSPSSSRLVMLEASSTEYQAVEEFMNSPSQENWIALVKTVQQRQPSERSVLLL